MNKRQTLKSINCLGPVYFRRIAGQIFGCKIYFNFLQCSYLLHIWLTISIPKPEQLYLRTDTVGLKRSWSISSLKWKQKSIKKDGWYKSRMNQGKDESRMKEMYRKYIMKNYSRQAMQWFCGSVYDKLSGGRQARLGTMPPLKLLLV